MWRIWLQHDGKSDLLWEGYNNTIAWSNVKKFANSHTLFGQKQVRNAENYAISIVDDTEKVVCVIQGVKGIVFAGEES